MSAPEWPQQRHASPLPLPESVSLRQQLPLIAYVLCTTDSTEGGRRVRGEVEGMSAVGTAREHPEGPGKNRGGGKGHAYGARGARHGARWAALPIPSAYRLRPC